MTSQKIRAVYENGVFRPLTPPELPIEDGTEVSVSITEEPELSPEEITELATSVYKGLTDEEIREIEEIILDRSHFNSHSSA